MNTETNPEHPDISAEYLAHIPAQHRVEVQSDDSFQRMIQELSADPDLSFLYAETILRKNQEPLMEKTRAQITQLEEQYFEKEGSLISLNMIEEIRTRMRNTEKRIKLGMFEEFIESMKVIKGGRKDFNATTNEFISRDVSDPENAKSGGYDIPICAHQYTYCSFDDISHYQAIGARDVSVIDDSDFQGRAEILTMDIADLIITSYTLKRSHMDLLMKNLFDYEGGKKILALYCALVFHDVNEAREFFHNNIGRMKAGCWYRDPTHVAGLTEDERDSGYRLARFVNSKEECMEDLREDNGMLDEHGMPTDKISASMKRLLDIQQAMIGIFKKTGIVPPLTLEVRVPTRAKAIVGGTYNNWVSPMIEPN